jgi:uncharacterized protein (TIGR02594 family)
MSKTTDNEAFALHAQTTLKARGHYLGDIDGWAGPITRKAFDAALPPPATTKPPAPTGNAARLYAQALRDKGLKETSGSASTPRIRRAIMEAASWLDPDDSVTAWCGCIMGLWCSEVGITPPAEYFRAANWLNIGKPVDISKAKQGDIVVLSRSGGNHVALYHSHSATHITLLGGNQKNAVNLSTYSRDSLRGIRAV